MLSLFRRAPRTARAGLLARFSRRCLITAANIWIMLALAGSIALLAVAPSAFMIAAVIALVLYGGRRAISNSGLFGTGRWADTNDLLAAGMFNGNGLPLGKVRGPSFWLVYRALRAARGAAVEGLCALVFASMRRQPVRVHATRGVHTLVVAPAGRGKTTGFIIPYLLECDDCMVVLDIKGELAPATAQARMRMGHRVVVLDPYQQVLRTPDRLNPLDLIDPDSPLLRDMAMAYADALVVRTGHEHEPHWNAAAEMWITAALCALCSCSDRHDRDLAKAAAIIAGEATRAKLIAVLRSLGGGYATMGDELENFKDKELASVLTTTARHLRFLNTQAVATSTSESTFDPRELITGNMTIYLVIPPHMLNVQSGLLRLWITALLRMVTDSGLKTDKRIRFVIDEAAALGRLDAIESGLAQLRGYGLNMVLVYQSLGQLKKCFPEGQDQTVAANCDTRVFFGVNDLQTADEISKQLGEATVTKVSTNTNTQRSVSRDAQGQPSYSTSTTSGATHDEMARALLKPEEVLQMDERNAVVFAPGIPPLLTRLVRYYEPEYRARRWSRLGLASRCFGVLLASIAAAALATMIALHTQGVLR